MRRFLVVSIATLAALTAAAPASRGESEPQSWQREFTVAAKPTITIRSDDARVTVHSWKETRVKVDVERRGHTEGLVLGHPRPRVEIDQQGNTIRVLARIEGSTSGFVINTARLEVEVWLPVESDLRIDTEDGPVSVEDVSGRIDVETQDGRLSGRGLRGDLDLRTADGRVELEDLDGSLHLETQDGPSIVRGRFDRMNVSSTDGGIDIVARPGSKLREEWSVRSQDGGIRMRIPRDLVATIDARTADGGLSVDLPLRVQGEMRHHELVGDLNGGGPILRLRCSDGSIHLGAD